MKVSRRSAFKLFAGTIAALALPAFGGRPDPLDNYATQGWKTWPDYVLLSELAPVDGNWASGVYRGRAWRIGGRRKGQTNSCIDPLNEIDTAAIKIPIRGRKYGYPFYLSDYPEGPSGERNMVSAFERIMRRTVNYHLPAIT